jgi:hypothetical protein
VVCFKHSIDPDKRKIGRRQKKKPPNFTFTITCVLVSAYPMVSELLISCLGISAALITFTLIPKFLLIPKFPFSKIQDLSFMHLVIICPAYATDRHVSQTVKQD